MTEVILFDWGDTLMVDFPGVPGKMKDWQRVEAVKGAENTLEYLRSKVRIYVASGAQESSPEDIEAALERVNLAQYIDGYFCPANLGIQKGLSSYYKAISQKLDTPVEALTMVGNSLEGDILPAQQAGLNTIWFNINGADKHLANIKQIAQLGELKNTFPE